MTLLAGEEAVRVYRVATGRAAGAKVAQGDDRTPEGLYHVDGFKPDSQFHRAISISYPAEADRRRAAELGVRPGGLIMIHGLDPGIERQWREDHWMFNWTRGCIAVTNREIEELWDLVTLGMPIEIRA
jgi:murein L,D-transpeptidase YafK